MGTRGLVGVVIDGEIKSSYNHWDSYPSGLGVKVVETVQGFLSSPDGLANLKNKARAMTLVNEDEQPTVEQATRFLGHADTEVSTGAIQEWYVLLRKLQGDLAGMLEAGVMIDGSGFELDSLFCEWAYLVDLDREVLEVYQGFQTERHDKGRWAGLPTDETIEQRAAEAQKQLDANEINQDQFNYFSKTSYHSIALIAEIPFVDLTEAAVLVLEDEDD